MSIKSGFAIIEILILIGVGSFAVPWLTLPRSIAQPSTTNPPAPHSTTLPAASSSTIVPTGKIAFVNDRGGKGQIYVMNSDGTGVTRLTNNLGQDNDPNWSPDGAKLVFKRTRDGGKGQIHVMNADGTGSRRLTTDSAAKDAFENAQPAWSPDGSKIVFVSTRDGRPQIYTMHADGTNIERLTNSPRLDLEPSWSPDGSKIIFQRFITPDLGVPGQNIYTVKPDGSGLKQLTATPMKSNGDAKYSPDGSKVSFASDRDGPVGIYVMNADGSNPIRLTNFPNNVHAGDMSWSPDGGKIVFERSVITFRRSVPVSSVAEVWIMNADGSEQMSLKQNCDPNACSPRWQPRGVK